MSHDDDLLLGPLPEPYQAALTAVYRVIRSAHSIRLLLAQSATSGTDAHADLHRLLRLWSDVRQGFGRAREAYGKVASQLAVAGGPVHFGCIDAASGHEAALEYQRLVFLELESVVDLPAASRWAGLADEALKVQQRVPAPDERLLGQLREAHARFSRLHLPEVKTIIAAMRVEAVKAAVQACPPATNLAMVDVAPDNSGPPPRPYIEWCFAPSGKGYFIAGFGESGHLSSYKGLAVISILIKTPGVAVPMLYLVGADLRLNKESRSQQPALDREGLRQAADRLRELRADLARAKKDNNTVEADVARVQIEQLEATLASARGIRGKARDLNNHYDKLRPRIHGQLQTLYRAMREADPPMRKLPEHFELSISAEGGSCFVYRPAGDPPAWQFDYPL
jgi:hypothetical protein